MDDNREKPQKKENGCVGAASSGSASARTKIIDEVEKKEYEVEDGNELKQHPRWQTPKKTASKKFMAAYSRGHENGCSEDGCCGNDDGYWSGFTRLVPHWP